VPRSDLAKTDDQCLLLVRKWHTDLQHPEHLSDTDYASFLWYCTEFFLDRETLWRKDSQGAHKIVTVPNKQMEIMRNVHDEVGHKGFYPTRALVWEQFWWPHLQADIVWFICTCHLCQIQQMRQVLIPLIVATPAPLFTKIYVDTMHMLLSAGYKYIVQGCCSLTQYPEFRKLRAETVKKLLVIGYLKIFYVIGVHFKR
jgi:hypothetical protein